MAEQKKEETTVSRALISEIIGEHVKALLNDRPQLVKMLTDIGSNREAYDFGTMTSIANRYDLDFLEDNVNEWLILRVSKGRKREEAIVNVVKSPYESNREDRRLREKIKDLFG